MAVLVTDTHPLWWYATGQPRKLSPRALRAFQMADRDRALIYVPAVVLWEISLLLKLGRLRVETPFDQWMEMLLAKRGFDLAHLEPSVIAAALGLGAIQDPFDAAVVATALTLDLPLITKDERITRAGVIDIVW
jgi:PIN domain nuclease of toxin-antitoxin system